MKSFKVGVVLGLVLLANGLVAPLAHADVNDFTIESFDADYTLGEDDPQGTLTVKEQLSVNFTDYNHGIYRAIPNKYNGLPEHVKVTKVTRDGVAEPYSSSKDNGNKVLKIGDANRTITGLHHYEIDYHVANVVRVAPDGTAQLDWNVNGTAWDQPFLHVSAQLHVPSNLADKLHASKCYTGKLKSTVSDCLVTDERGVKAYTTTRELSAGETLTFNDSIPAGYFKRPTLVDKLKDYAPQIALAAGLPLLALLLAGGAWFRHGRDARGHGTIIPEYGPPADLKAAEMDVILHNKLGKNAVSATIIDLAIRKYLRIQESQSKGVLGLGKHKEYTFIKLPAPANDSLTDFETAIYAGIFSHGDTVDVTSLKNSFYITLKSIQKSIPKSLTTRGFFRANPTLAGNIWHVLGVILLFGSFYLMTFGAVVLVGTVGGGLIFLLFGTLMPSRTAQGAAAKDAAAGLKLYLNTAEKDRIAMLQSPDAPYAETSAEPVKTVELFEKLLPYAMVLGVEQQWAKQFESIYTSPPDWYGGNWSTFNALYLTQSLSNSMSAMNTSFAAPSSSSSGFSGGAGGGGGGGGW